MKKTLLMLLAVMFSVAMLADDIIITKDSQRINAKIEEVGVDVVKYRRTDNLTGPLYSISKAEIASIIYENGTVEAFNTKNQTVTKPSSAKSINPALSKLECNRNRLYSQDGKFVTHQECLALFQDNCPQALNLYRKGKTLDDWAWGMFFPAAISTIPGVMLCIFGALEDKDFYKAYAMTASGAALTAFGGSCIITSIILGSASKSRMSECVDVYNSQCAPNLTLNLTAGQNGIGLALNF